MTPWEPLPARSGYFRSIGTGIPPRHRKRPENPRKEGKCEGLLCL